MAEHEGRARFVLCADDPLVADLGREREGVTYFGLEDDSQALPGLQHAADSKHCRNCGHAYVYDAVYLGHLGRWHCPNCGRARPAASGRGAGACVLEGMSGSRLELSTPAGEISARLPVPGLYNVYNAIAAAATALELGVAAGSRARRAGGLRRRFGRVETIPVEGRDVSILLVKNPAGANEVLRTLALEEGELDLWLALNDKIADGRDVSWIWDADFELLAGRTRRVTCSGTRAEEMALRLKYAGVEAEPVVDRDLEPLWSPPLPTATTAGPCSPCPPTRRCWTCATCWRAAAWPGGGRTELADRRGPRDRLARRRVRRLRGRPRRLAELAEDAGGPRAGRGLRLGAGGPGPGRARPRRHRRRLRGAAGRRAAPPGAASRRLGREVADARSLDLGRRFPLAIAPMQVVQLMGGPAGAPGC